MVKVLVAPFATFLLASSKRLSVLFHVSTAEYGVIFYDV